MMISPPAPRTGLNTKTGDRNATRQTGSNRVGDPRRSVSTRFEPVESTGEAIQRLMKKNEQDIQDAERQWRQYKDWQISGKIDPTLSDFRNLVRQSSQEGAQNLDRDMRIVEGGYGRKQAMDIAQETSKKNLGLGEYKGAGSTQSVASGETWEMRMAREAAEYNAREMERRKEQRLGRADELANQSAADAAYSQRYAAAQAADAQKYASQMQLIGQLSSPGNYKYWGG